ncbi:MAG TPA: class 1 fructose-bisphosphatase [Bradyrhizobium sp.]|uniref:class 1 fructose-bisphosphatase n=1 Tax=Bradyrhizobium sp. TaxID=376 RepID=UPI002C4D2E6F|nr:class 1 fructose-bisphosphatase [Bradyrhizobium sp.]HLZ05310.1 class 1 fructose-bisphosphatase [Bradyrhizobium sp.]
MDYSLTLDAYLGGATPSLGQGSSVATVITCLASAAVELSELIAAGPLSGIDGRDSGTNSGGDRQIDIDVEANRLMCAALRKGPVAAIVSEETELPEILDSGAGLCVAIDPLDGSANLANNISVGTIFSIRRRSRDALSTFFEPGTAQQAAGCFIYGPQTTLVLALEHSVDIFILDRRSREFVLIRRGVRIPSDTAEFAINMSNRRHWNAAVDAYIDHCLLGASGEYGEDFNMRWIGSLVAEAYRILMRGGVFLYPADARRNYHEGRLRLLYEAHPMALIMEWAGGAASTGRDRILDLSARMPHQRAPLIMGSARAVRDLNLLHQGVQPLYESSKAPLFARRGLFL